jgi:small subunit ribosomal protein S15
MLASLKSKKEKNNENRMEKREIVEKFGRAPRDTGSSEVQVALLTKHIEDISKHLEVHKKDHATRLGLLKLVGRRRRLLRYLSSRDRGRYQSLIAALGLRKSAAGASTFSAHHPSSSASLPDRTKGDLK